MDDFVLLIDDLGRVEAVLERVLAGTGLRVESFTDPVAAKRRLVEASPKLIVSLNTFQNHPDGGFKLAKEVSGHEQLAAIPLVIISDQLSEDVIRQATESGAKSLIPWPVTIESLKNRLKPFLPALSPAAPPEPEVAEEKPAAAPAKISPAESEGAQSLGAEQKIQRAQQLLALVLHNLKTSALLEVIDLEDVPRVVIEITRSVCGVKAPEQQFPQKKAGEKAGSAQEAAPAAAKPLLPKEDVELDLDAVFGRKR